MSTVKDVPVDLARLPGMTVAELETVWRSHLGGPPSARLPKSLVANKSGSRPRYSSCDVLRYRLGSIGVTRFVSRSTANRPSAAGLSVNIIRQVKRLPSSVQSTSPGYNRCWNGRAN